MSTSKSNPASTPPKGLFDHIWAAAASEGTTAILVLMLAAFVLVVTTFIPQGADAVEVARDPNAVVIRTLSAWGLTNVFTSAWVKAFGVLIGANLLAMAIGGLGRAKSVQTLSNVPKSTPLGRDVDAPFPDTAIESLRDVLVPRLGVPVLEAIRGSKVLMVFEPGASAAIAPHARLFGLLLLIVAAGLHTSDTQGKDTIPAAILDVTDTRSGTTGHFDMVAGEPFTFFQWPAKYLIHSYTPAREGLGPAIRIERRAQGQQRGEMFWVHLNAPPGFDARHRGGEVSIDARWIGRAPVPGSGLADSPVVGLLIAGMAGLLFGVFASRGAAGRIWVQSDGRKVTFSGVPKIAGDAGFSSRFERCAAESEAALQV